MQTRIPAVRCSLKSFFSHEEGRVRRAGTALIYETFLKDHLGNVRVMFTDADGDGWVDPADDDEVLQVDHFYPFGLRMAGISTAPAVPNFYTFTGKEYQDELGLGWTDFGARMYDASVGRWNGVDILAEKYFSISPFGFALNNPVLFVDPFGMDTYYYDENGGFLRFERNDKKNEIHFMNRDKFEQIVLNALMTPMAPIETDLSTSLNEASTFFIGENTAKGLRSHERNTQKNRREYGGFMYYTNENKEVRLHECAECPINEDAQIGLDGYSPKLLPEDVFFVGSWHTHPKGRNGEIIFDYRPSRSDYDAGKFFINRIQVKPRSDELTSINGGPGVIGYSGGVILFQHSLNAKGNVAYRPTSNDFRSFSYDWFSKSGGSVAYFRFLVFGPMAAEFAKPVKE